jgi:hypothetical protein
MHDIAFRSYLRILLSTSIFIGLDESSNGTVVGFFDIIWEKAGRKFFHGPVILNAFATDSFAAARFI